MTAVAEVMPTLVANIDREFLTDNVKVVCVPVVLAAHFNAAEDVAISVDASVSVLNAGGVKST